MAWSDVIWSLVATSRKACVSDIGHYINDVTCLLIKLLWVVYATFGGIIAYCYCTYLLCYWMRGSGTGSLFCGSLLRVPVFYTYPIRIRLRTCIFSEYSSPSNVFVYQPPDLVIVPVYCVVNDEDPDQKALEEFWSGSPWFALSWIPFVLLSFRGCQASKIRSDSPLRNSVPDHRGLANTRTSVEIFWQGIHYPWYVCIYIFTVWMLAVLQAKKTRISEPFGGSLARVFVVCAYPIYIHAGFVVVV